MDIGQKIKQARLEAGLSQRQLCGDTITRNMLSLIESGRARPGMDTLTALAGRLGKSVSFFLEEDSVALPNRQVMTDARAAFAGKDYHRALEVLKDYAAPDPVFDPERVLMECLCMLELAKQAVVDGKDKYALSLLDKVEENGKKTPYYTVEVESERLLVLATAAPAMAAPVADRLPDWTDEVMVRARAEYDRGAYGRCCAVLEAAQRRTAGWYLLRGMAALELGATGEAAQALHRAEEVYPEQTAALLERCYRDMGDYKRAYEYAVKQRKDP